MGTQDICIIVALEASKKLSLSLFFSCLCVSLSLSLLLYRRLYRFLKRWVEGEGDRERETEKGLAGSKAITFRLFGGGGGGNKRKKLTKKKIKVKDRFMDWWHKMTFPVRRVWVAVSSRVKANKDGAGLLKLHNDVQTCGYEDVQVMWEMLKRSETELTAHNAKRKQRPFWRVFVWSNHSGSSSFSANNA